MQMYNQFGQDTSAFWMVALTISSTRDAYVELRAPGPGAAADHRSRTRSWSCVADGGAARHWPALPEALGPLLRPAGRDAGDRRLALGAASRTRSRRRARSRTWPPGRAGSPGSRIFGGMLAAPVLCRPVIAPDDLAAHRGPPGRAVAAAAGGCGVRGAHRVGGAAARGTADGGAAAGDPDGGQQGLSTARRGAYGATGSRSPRVSSASCPGTAPPPRARPPAGRSGRGGRRRPPPRTGRGAGRGPSPGPRRGPARRRGRGRRGRGSGPGPAPPSARRRPRSRGSLSIWLREKTGRQPSGALAPSPRRRTRRGRGWAAPPRGRPRRTTCVRRRGWRRAAARTRTSRSHSRCEAAPSAEARMSQMTTARTRSGRRAASCQAVSAPMAWPMRVTGPRPSCSTAASASAT